MKREKVRAEDTMKSPGKKVPHGGQALLSGIATLCPSHPDTCSPLRIAQLILTQPQPDTWALLANVVLQTASG